MFRTIACALAATFLTTSVSAATFFTNESEWETAMASTWNITLENLPTAQTTATQDELTFSIVNPAREFFIGGPINWSSVIDGFDVAISGKEDIDVAIEGGTTGFAFTMHEPTSEVRRATNSCNTTCFDSTFMFSLFDGSDLVDSFMFNAEDDVANFVGFSSLIAFDRVEIRDLTATTDNEYFGEFRLGSLTPVPLPAGLPLLLAGMGAFAFCKRRKS